MLDIQNYPLDVICLDSYGPTRRKVAGTADNKNVLVVDVFSNAGHSLFRMILGELAETEELLTGGRFSNFDPECSGHSIDVTIKMEIMDVMGIVNSIAKDSNTKWGFRYDYSHMHDVKLSLQIEDDATACLLKMML